MTVLLAALSSRFSNQFFVVVVVVVVVVVAAAAAALMMSLIRPALYSRARHPLLGARGGE
jgi:hypothetical protein